MIFVHPLIDPVLFSIGIFEIRWYGLAYVLGFLIGLLLIKKLNSKFTNPINNKIIDDFFFWSIIGVIIGGRFGYVLFYQTNSIFYDPLSIFYIWQGGMSFHGGLIGICFSILVYSKIKKISFFQLSDLVSTVAPIGIFLGRLANFINIELYGRITDFRIAMIYPTVDNHPRHPSQLYEAFFEGLVLFIILYYLASNKFKNNIKGFNTSMFLMLYAIFRYLLEFLREPDSHLGIFFNYLTMGQILCLPMLLLGVIFYLNIKYDTRKIN